VNSYFHAIACLVFLLPIQNFAQPGQMYGTLSIDVVDGNGRPVRAVRIQEASTGSARFLGGKAFPPVAELNFNRRFKPRDAQESSFVATTYCFSREKFSYAINVSAEGYDPIIRNGEINSCFETVQVVLKRNGKPIPEYQALSEITGHLTDQNGKPVTDRLSIFGETEYVPKISSSGDYSARLPIGVYHVLFDPPGCTTYQIRNIRVEENSKTLDLKVDCQLTQVRPGTLLMRRTVY
jgi:hypothetical protein